MERIKGEGMSEFLEARLRGIARQEELLVLDHFDATVAFSLATHIRDAALAANVGVTIEVVVRDNPIVVIAMDGTTLMNKDYARRKRNLVNLMERSSYAIATDALLGRDWIERMSLDPRDHGLHGGCFPLRVRGAGMIGSIAVSGLAQGDDHRLIVEALADHCGVDRALVALPVEG